MTIFFFAAVGYLLPSDPTTEFLSGISHHIDGEISSLKRHERSYGGECANVQFHRLGAAQRLESYRQMSLGRALDLSFFSRLARLANYAH